MSQYAPPPPPAPQLPPPVQPEVKRRKPFYARWWFILLAAIVALIVVVSVAGGGDDPTATTTTEAPASDEAPAAEPEAAPAPEQAAPAEEAAPAVAGVGTSVRDGKFEFVVTGIERPGTQISDDSGFLTEQAQGEYLIVRVDVTNIGDQPQTLVAEAQYLYDAEARKYETSSDAIFLSDFDKSFLQEINPGVTVSGAPLLYDVPAGFVLASLELHDSLFSGGVTVALQ